MMELDDLKQALTALDRKLDRQVAIQERVLHQRNSAAVSRSLRPLARGQIVQAIGGILSILLGVAAWRSAMDQMGGLFFSGVLVHVYGVAMVATAILTRIAIRPADDSGPVLVIQRRLAELRRLNVRVAYVLGMSWWFLWVPFLIVGVRVAFGADLYAINPAMTHFLVCCGVVGLVACAALHRWAAATGRTRVAAAFDDALMGRSVRDAETHLAEITRFQRD
jgi:serine/threonine-protein kinase